ncbi:PilZ domain-containing protein [Salinarimonas rosea]|uniref:PilZ domain-containing protein n=1 Tax=Salinarimonas rosea TaxID=552063 RepID=UPI00048EB69B|nr:PilZ domain-containing protein [Salinarimonas rosea]
MSRGWVYEGAAPSDERRREIRRTIGIPSVAYDTARRLRYACTVVDISQHGAQVHCSKADALPDTFVLLVNGTDAIRRVCDVVRRSPTRLGVRFRGR